MYLGAGCANAFHHFLEKIVGIPSSRTDHNEIFSYDLRCRGIDLQRAYEEIVPVFARALRSDLRRWKFRITGKITEKNYRRVPAGKSVVGHPTQRRIHGRPAASPPRANDSEPAVCIQSLASLSNHTGHVPEADGSPGPRLFGTCQGWTQARQGSAKPAGRVGRPDWAGGTGWLTGWLGG